MQLEHSRGLLLAEQATRLSANGLERRLDESTVVISLDAAMPNSELTARVLIATLRRGLGNLVLTRAGVPPALVEILEQSAYEIDPTRPLRVVNRPNENVNVRIHIGPSATGRAVRVVPEGYGAHIAGARSAVIRPKRPGNSLGAVFAAALGAAEAFKYTAGVVTARRVLHRHLRFCPVSLSGDLSEAPDMEALSIALSLLGVGAIGTGIALILSELPLEGTMLVVDKQRFARENRGTYSLGGSTEVVAEPWKTDLAKAVLRRFDVTTFNAPVEQLVAAVDSGSAPWFPTVLTALDSPDARREAQRLWPDRLIDAATGDTMLGLCDHRYGIDPCLMCVFPVRRGEPSGAERIALRLGLSSSVLAQADTLLSDAHLEGLTDEQQRMLKPHLGIPMCGLAQAAGLTDAEDNSYMPSVPFVSLQAACLSVGRLLRGQLYGLPPTSNFVQYDGLFGPQAATIESMGQRQGCVCSTRSDAIGQVRAARAAAAHLNGQVKSRRSRG